LGHLADGTFDGAKLEDGTRKTRIREETFRRRRQESRRVETKVTSMRGRIGIAEDLVTIPRGDDILFWNSDMGKASQTKLVRITGEEVIFAAVNILDVLGVAREFDGDRTLRSNKSLNSTLGKGSYLFCSFMYPGVVTREEGLDPDLVTVNINNDRTVYPDEGEIRVISGIVSLFPRHTNIEALKTGLKGEISGEATPEGNSFVATFYFARFAVLVDVGPDTLSSEIVTLFESTSGNFNVVIMNEVGEMGGALI